VLDNETCNLILRPFCRDFWLARWVPKNYCHLDTSAQVTQVVTLRLMCTTADSIGGDSIAT